MSKVLIFGGTGFIGTQVVEKLLAAGHHIIAIAQHPEKGMHLQPFGDIGQIACIKGNVLDMPALEKYFKDVDIVINLIGVLYPKGKATFDVMHHQVPAQIAEYAAKYNVGKLIHISALGIDKAAAPDVNSSYAKSKLAGEQAVLKNFPNAMVLRPSIVFGTNDSFFNMFAGMAQISPALPLIAGGTAKFQPVYVGDVADAVIKGVGGTTGLYALGGPQVYSFKQLLELLLKQMGKKRLLVKIPAKLAKFKGFLAEKLLPKPPLTRDQVKLLKIDNVVEGELKTFADLGIEPTPLEVILPTYVLKK